MKLSILVPYIRRHEAFFHKLRFEFFRQMLPYDGQVEFLSDNHEYDTIGVKRNRLLERATGEYLCFFDADDQPSENYIELLMGIDEECTHASLKGLYSVDGVEDGVFEHSILYKEWKTTNKSIKYERYPNHLNLIKSDIAKRFKFPEINHGEDHNWSTQIHKSGVLTDEYYIPEVIYYYNYISNK